MRNHRLTARLIVASLSLTLFFTAGCRPAQAQDQSRTAEDDGLKSKFEQFHKQGFGIESVTNVRDAVSTSGNGSNMLDIL